jgi:hypothetical protein
MVDNNVDKLVPGNSKQVTWQMLQYVCTPLDCDLGPVFIPESWFIKHWQLKTENMN